MASQASDARSSHRLLQRAARGDATALGDLLVRHLPRLRRWAHGRLPRWARTLADTSDLVQETWLRTLGRLGTLDAHSNDVLAAYLREAVRNRIRDEHRRFARRGPTRPLPDSLIDRSPSPLELTIGSESAARYQAALGRLTVADRELIVAHVELDYSHAQLGCMTGRSANAARMALQRAVARLAREMHPG